MPKCCGLSTARDRPTLDLSVRVVQCEELAGLVRSVRLRVAWCLRAVAASAWPGVAVAARRSRCRPGALPLLPGSSPLLPGTAARSPLLPRRSRCCPTFPLLPARSLSLPGRSRVAWAPPCRTPAFPCGVRRRGRLDGLFMAWSRACRVPARAWVAGLPRPGGPLPRRLIPCRFRPGSTCSVAGRDRALVVRHRGRRRSRRPPWAPPGRRSRRSSRRGRLRHRGRLGGRRRRRPAPGSAGAPSGAHRRGRSVATRSRGAAGGAIAPAAPRTAMGTWADVSRRRRRWPRRLRSSCFARGRARARPVRPRTVVAPPAIATQASNLAAVPPSSVREQRGRARDRQRRCEHP